MIPKIYRWLSITQESKHKLGSWVCASYHVKTKSIITYDRMLKKTPEQIELVLFHEWCHHIYMTKINRISKLIWGIISNWKLITILNIFWLTKYKVNKYVSVAW